MSMRRAGRPAGDEHQQRPPLSRRAATVRLEDKLVEAFTTSEATWAAMKSGLTLELVLLILTFTSTAFYESREAPSPVAIWAQTSKAMFTWFVSI